jgi:hypothetical protein
LLRILCHGGFFKETGMNFALAKTEDATPLPAWAGPGWAIEIAGSLEAAEGAWRDLLKQDCFATAYRISTSVPCGSAMSVHRPASSRSS